MTKEEDKLLADRAEYHLLHTGEIRWAQIQKKYFPERTSKSIRERYYEHLDPRLDKSDFDEEEREFISNFVLTHGNRWTELAKHLPGRSPNRLKNYWNRIKKKEMKKIVPI
ncbi:MAG: Myb-like DNA-binding domain-containing protein [Oligoflexales bacterium]